MGRQRGRDDVARAGEAETWDPWQDLLFASEHAGPAFVVMGAGYCTVGVLQGFAWLLGHLVFTVHHSATGRQLAARAQTTCACERVRPRRGSTTSQQPLGAAESRDGRVEEVAPGLLCNVLAS